MAQALGALVEHALRATLAHLQGELVGVLVVGAQAQLLEAPRSSTGGRRGSILLTPRSGGAQTAESW